jgi:type IV pilus assembly protein PilY1
MENQAIKSILRIALVGAVACFLGLGLMLPVHAQTTVNLADTPLLALKNAPGLVMLNMSRDHRLYYAAYNDTSDINGDGAIDVGFKPEITYYGYFVSDRCYSYSTTTNRFRPRTVAAAADVCQSSVGRWHGNWLNWVHTSRMDALRKVLYGGYRSTDTATLTVLDGAYVPGDSHVWGKEYRPTSVGGPDSYNIRHYTPLPTPGAGQMHIFLQKSEGFASNPTPDFTLSRPPVLRVAQNVDAIIDRVWIWASSERPIGNANGDFRYNRPGFGLVNNLPGYQNGGTAYPALSYTATYTLTASVQACVAIGGVREAGCVGYPANAPTSWKPTGVLHDYSKDDALKFGLITGSYRNNYSGGVVRKDIGSFSDEIDSATGIYSATNGIAKAINRLQTYGFNGVAGTPDRGNYEYDCGFLFNGLRSQNTCHMWGSPVAEMMYEGLRYFGGKTPTPAYLDNVADASSPDTLLALPLVSSWANPYRPKTSGGSPICSKPVQMVIADPITSFDSDQLPGASFPNVAANGAALPAGAGNLNTSGSLNVTTQANEIWNTEVLGTTTSTNASGNAVTVAPGTLYGSSNQFFMGQTTLANSDGNPTAKAATTFSTMRGHGPDETNTQGSYYAASVARYGQKTGIDVTDGVAGGLTQVNTVDQISVALGSVVPRIEFKYLNRNIALVPISKSVGAGSINAAIGQFQPTGLITLLYFDQIYNTSPSNTTSTVNGGRPYLRFMASFSDIDQGADNEADANVYYTVYIDSTGKLQVQTDFYYQAGSIKQNMGYIISGTTKDGVYLEVGDEGNNNPIYYLDTLTGQDPAPAGGRVIANAVRLPASNLREFILGAGGGATFVPKDPLWYAAKYGGAGIVDSNGDPTNYFRITNPSELPTQIGKAFKSAAAVAAVASTSVVGVGQRSVGSAAIFQANYDSVTWSSRLYAFQILSSGAVSNSITWEVSTKVPDPSLRTKLFLGRGKNVTPFNLTPSSYASLTAAEKADFGDTPTFAYLLGDKSGEERKGGNYRNRGTTAGAEYGSVIGDIVNSDPQVISKKDYDYTASDASYATFLNTIDFETLAVSTNSGFFHVFDAEADSTGGVELLGFMPQAARKNIKELASIDYKHRNIVDGSIGIGHAKIPVPGDATPRWRSVAVGTGGDGAQTVFAIDTTTKTFTANSFLWEINTATLAISNPTLVSKFGNIMGKPVIGKLNDGTWVAVFGNGYNSADGQSLLFIADLATGTLIRVLATNSVTGNGLGATEIVRKTGGNRDTIDYVYGVDYKGHVWRFDPNTNANGVLIYKTPNGRPITAELRVEDAPASSGAVTAGGKMLYFGTGSYLSSTDPTSTTTQAIYGIYDDLLHGLSTSAFVSESELTFNTLSLSPGADVRTTSVAATPTWFTVTGKKGWGLELSGTNVQAGERVIAPPVRYKVSGVVDAIIFTSLVPGTDDCKAGIDTWITGVDATTGGFARVFNNIESNAVRISGGSPRGVFVLSDGARPVLYTSQTIFNGVVPTTSYTTNAGGSVGVGIGGVNGLTRTQSIDLFTGSTPPGVPANSRQVWRQLK